MNIKLRTALDVRDGYGYIGQELALALHEFEHNVWVQPVQMWFSEEELKPRTKELMTQIDNLEAELIIMYPVFTFRNLHPRSSMLTMYEANGLPTEWIQAINQRNIPILCPSLFVKNVFEESGIKVPCYHLPLGIRTDYYYFKERRFPTNRPFRFLSIGKMEPRKNIEAALRAFGKVFSKKTYKDVEFWVKTRQGFVSNEVKRIIQYDDRIKVLDKTVRETTIQAFYYETDCFVYPSRGEGFSFPPRNALATGMPTIVTNWSALAEIPGAMKVNIKGLSPMYPCGFSYGEEKKLLMADIDEEELATYMMMTYSRYELMCKEIKDIKQDDWSVTVKALERILNGMSKS